MTIYPCPKPIAVRRKVARYIEIAKASLIHRRGDLCEMCHERPATDLHHCLFRRDKNRPELNHEFNYQCVCHTCHMKGLGDTLDNRRAFYTLQVERYGLAFETWLEEEIKPLYKIKRFDFMDNRRIRIAFSRKDVL